MNRFKVIPNDELFPDKWYIWDNQKDQAVAICFTPNESVMVVNALNKNTEESQ